MWGDGYVDYLDHGYTFTMYIKSNCILSIYFNFVNYILIKLKKCIYLELYTNEY